MNFSHLSEHLDLTEDVSASAEAARRALGAKNKAYEKHDTIQAKNARDLDEILNFFAY